MSLKVSKYNFCVFQEDGSYLIYNTLSNALAVLKPENYIQFRAFEEENRPLTEEFQKKLKYCGFLVDEEFDELMYIRRRMFQERFSFQSLILTIAPTMECNFKCDYCFETEKREGKMTDVTINNLLEFVQKQYRKEKKISVNWMGGEPLLAVDVIEKISVELVAFCQEKNMEYFSGIITNGYYLTPDIAKTLTFNLKIKNYQITLDGVGAVHDKKRPLLDGGPTFDVIMKNIYDSIDYIPALTVRVNLDKENYENADQIMDLFDLENIKPKVNLVFSLTNAVSDQVKDRCLSIREYSKINQVIREKKIKRGFYESCYPKAIFNPCGVTSSNNFVIDSMGRIFKCWSDYGFPERAIGVVGKDPDLKQLHNDNRYLLYDPTVNENCRQCKILPLCMGGCYWKRFYLGEIPCSNSKFDLTETLEVVVKNKLYQLQNYSQGREV